MTDFELSLVILGLLVACVVVVMWANRREPGQRLADTRERRQMMIEQERSRGPV